MLLIFLISASYSTGGTKIDMKQTGVNGQIVICK